MTHYLRFPDEATGMAALRDAGFVVIDEDGIEQIITATHTYAVDPIGIIIRFDQGTETPVTLPGWHVNLIGDLPTGWQPYVVQPLHPVRVFAGVEALLAS
jgi:hypothetical protein